MSIENKYQKAKGDRKPKNYKIMVPFISVSSERKESRW